MACTEHRYYCYFEPCKYWSPSLRNFMLHLRSYHLFENNSFTCNIDGCLNNYHSVSTYRKHIIYAHAQRWKEGKTVASVDGRSNALTGPEAPLISGDSGASCCSANEDISVHDSEVTYDSLIKSVSTQHSLLHVTSRYKFDIPDRKVQHIMSVVSDMLQDFKSNYDECLKEKLKNVSLPEDVKFMINDNISLDNALKLTSSTEEQVLRQFGYVEPVEITFPTIVGQKKNCAHYVPIEDTLKGYLSRPDVFTSIQRERTPGKNLANMSCGDIMNSHPVLSEDQTCIRLVMYTDEFQICNALGAHTKKHSIVGVYFAVNNIETKHSGKLCHIHLAMLVKEIFMVAHSKDVVFERLVNDLLKLENEGIDIEVEGDKHHLKVVVAALVGDNKSLHSIGGFRQNFNSGPICRHCMINHSKLSTVVSESECNLRSVDSFDYHVSSVMKDPSLSNVYGVTNQSVFSKLKSFHPVTSLPCDVMHDGYEGFIPFNIKAVIRGLVKDKVLTMAQIASLFEKFEYGPTDKDNKHPGFSAAFPGKKASLPGTAAEKLNLFRIFTLVLGPHVPEDNKYWLLHLKCLDICDYLLPPVLDPGWPVVLENLIKEYLHSFSQLPEDIVGSFKPKMHYLVHLPRQCLIFGPPRHLSCMKFEHFHLYFKREAEVMKNYINPTLTLACNFQKKRCIENSGTDLFPSIHVLSSQKELSSVNLRPPERHAVTFFYDKEECLLLSVLKVKIEGRLLMKDTFVIIDVTHESIPVFVKILGIYSCEGRWAVSGQLTFPLRWCEHLHAYEVMIGETEGDHVCISPFKVVPLQTLSLYDIKGKSYLKLRHQPLPVD